MGDALPEQAAGQQAQNTRDEAEQQRPPKRAGLRGSVPQQRRGRKPEAPPAQPCSQRLVVATDAAVRVDGIGRGEDDVARFQANNTPVLEDSPEAAH